MVTVGENVSEVEVRLAAGLLACPGCEGRLGPWGHGRARVLRGPDGPVAPCRPRRARCGSCGVTHVLLPVNVLLRRADEAEVIGAALALSVTGWGYRRIAEWLGRAADTVRGWVRRARERAEVLRAGFTGLLVAVDPEPVLPAPAGSVLGDAVAAVVAAAVATVRRWGPAMSGLSPWELAAAVSAGRLLSPTHTPMSINTSCPW